MDFETLKNYGIDIILGIWGILKPILWFLKKIVIDLPVWFWNKFPFEYYHLFYILLFGSILVWLLEKIPAVSDFINWHSDVLYLSKKFNIGIATHLLIYDDIRTLLLCMLIIFPGMAFCAALIQKGNYGLSPLKLSFIFTVNMIVKWLDYRHRVKNLRRWEEQPVNVGAGFEEARCLFYTALLSWLRGAKDNNYENIFFIHIIVWMGILAGLIAVNLKGGPNEQPPERRFNIYIATNSFLGYVLRF